MISIENIIQDKKYNTCYKYRNITTKNIDALAMREACFINACYIFVMNKIPSVRSFL